MSVVALVALGLVIPVVLAAAVRAVWVCSDDDVRALPRSALLRSEELVETWKRKYVLGEIEVDELEDGIARALVGRADAATEAQAEAIRASRPHDLEWVALAHEAKLKRLAAEHEAARLSPRWIVETRGTPTDS